MVVQEEFVPCFTLYCDRQGAYVDNGSILIRPIDDRTGAVRRFCVDCFHTIQDSRFRGAKIMAEIESQL